MWRRVASSIFCEQCIPQALSGPLNSAGGISSTLYPCTQDSLELRLSCLHGILPHVRISHLENLHFALPTPFHSTAVTTLSAAMCSRTARSSHSFPIRVSQALIHPYFLRDFPFFETRLHLPAPGAHLSTGWADSHVPSRVWFALLEMWVEAGPYQLHLTMSSSFPVPPNMSERQIVCLFDNPWWHPAPVTSSAQKSDLTAGEVWLPPHRDAL